MSAVGDIGVAALYRFARFADPHALREPLLAIARAGGVRGTILLATEGVNGTIAGSPEGVAPVGGAPAGIAGMRGPVVNWSQADVMPFHRLKVKVKREIVTMGETVDPLVDAGTDVAPKDWNALIADPGTLLIDTRNTYEVAVGTFPGAVDPKTAGFADFPAWLPRAPRGFARGQGARGGLLRAPGHPLRRSSTAFLKQEGVETVHHLDGGILRYLEEVPAA
ncbi:hypothetical protein AB5I41_06465 [Sphingomonas sp. MMS24-JH45]